MGTELGSKAVCDRFGADFIPVSSDSKVGLGRDASQGRYPVNGLRHPPQENTTGWFLWVGDDGPSREADYFVPLHAEHLLDRLPEVEPYLGLAPGWRFLIAPDYEDVWFDADLLDLP